jgi:hypothetical protein
MRTLAPFLLLFSLSGPLFCQEAAVSRQLAADRELDTDPASDLWKDAPVFVAERGPREEEVAGHRTEIRSRWTTRYLYFLFVCPYQELHLTANPKTGEETNKLWDHDVAEVFIGADFQKIWQYREFQVSPQGEWVDLDIDTRQPKPEGGWRWDSNFEVKARIDRENKVWYGAMKIPILPITIRNPRPGFEFRANFFRIQGPPPDKKFIAWRPTGKPSYHVPEAFGLLRLEK